MPNAEVWSVGTINLINLMGMTGHSYLEPISVFHLSYKNDIRKD
jgi:hypothetical protein